MLVNSWRQESSPRTTEPCPVAGYPCLTSWATLHKHFTSHGQPTRLQARVHQVSSEMLGGVQWMTTLLQSRGAHTSGVCASSEDLETESAFASHHFVDPIVTFRGTASINELVLDLREA